MSLLFTKKPIVINVGLAEVIGLNEAVVLQQIHYWLASTSSGVEHDGARWVFNTYQDWQEQFPFWSVDTVKRALTSLHKSGILMVEQLAKHKHDRTNYYSIRYSHPALMDQGNLPSSIGADLPALTETTTETTSERELGADAPSKSPSVVEFNGEDFSVTADLITKWSLAYAPVDVEAEIVRAAVWASGSPAKKDWRKFLVNWIGRSHKKAAGTVIEGSCPVDQIIALYHRVCPNLPVVTVAGDKVLRSMIVERWNESPDHQSGQDFWLPFFQKANNRNQVFFRGQNVAPRLEALVSRAVFRKISEAAQ